MLERITVAAIIIGLVVLGTLALRFVPALWRARLRRVSDSGFAHGDTRPTVLYFFTPECVDCRVRQAPALHALEQAHPGAFDLVKVDAVADGSLASRYHILTVPSTVILDPAGRVVDANLGFAPKERLRVQLGLG